MRVAVVVLFFSISLPAVAHNWGGFDSGYTREEVDALSLQIQQRLEREDTDAAVALVKRFIQEHSEDILLRQSNGHSKYRLIRSLVSSPAWAATDGTTQASILSIALKYGPLTPRYERELLYLMARTGTLEGMAAVLARALIPKSADKGYLSNLTYESLISHWVRAWHRLANGFLTADHPVEAHELVAAVAVWLSRFTHPDEVVMEVTARTSKQALQVLPLLISLRRDWPGTLSEVQANRLRYWQNARGCESPLIAPD